MKMKRIIAAFMAATMLATTSITANAATYHYSANQAMADGEIDGIINASLLNIGEFGCENLPVNPTDTPTEMLADIVKGELEDKVGLGDFLDYVNCLKWCHYAFSDLVQL